MHMALLLLASVTATLLVTGAVSSHGSLQGSNNSPWVTTVPGRRQLLQAGRGGEAGRGHGGRGKRVCVIGGGPSGIAAATQLEGKGYKVVLLEKDGFVGGRTRHFDAPDGESYAVGAVILSADHTNVLDLARRFGIRTGPPPVLSRSFAFDYKTGDVVLVEELRRRSGPIAAVAVQEAFIRYTAIHRTWKFNQGVPVAYYSVPTLQFLQATNLTALFPYLLTAVTMYGYGPLTATPMEYTLREVTPSTLADQIFFRESLPEVLERGGYQTLMQKWAATLKDVRLNVKILSVDRPKDGTTIVYYKIGNNKKQVRRLSCGSVVVAFPQYLPRLKFLSLDAREVAVFSKVKLNGYATAIIDMGPEMNARFPSPFAMTNSLNARGNFSPSALVEPPGDGHPVIVRRPASMGKNPLTQLYIWTSAFAALTEKETKDLALSFLPKLKYLGTPAANSTSPPPPLNASAFKFFSYWDYFPHVNSQDMAAGFEKNLRKMQGYRNTFWVGAILNFDIVENTIASTKQLVDTHF